MTIIIDGTGTISGVSATGLSAAQTVGYSSLPAGSVLQVLSTTKTDTFSTTSTSFVDVTGLSVSITPKFSTSKVLVICTLPVGHAASRVARANLVRNSTTLCQPASAQSLSSSKTAYIVSGDTLVSADFHFLDSPATTSSTTYKIQVCTNVGDNAMVVGNRTPGNDMSCPSTITVMEIAG
jgi:hypothetical protein